jgi:putative peptidoglycan lipid II flippase
MMSHQAAAGDFESLKDTFAFSMRVVSFITIPAAVGLVVLREPIIQVLFEHGQFVAASTRLTSQALFYYAFGLPAFAAIKLIVPAFYATHDTRLPVLVAAYTLALNIVLNVLCLRWLYPVFRNGGPAFATVVAAYFNFFTLFAMFRVRFGRLGTAPILASVARVAVCAAAMGALCWLALRWSNFENYRGFLPRAGIVAALLSGATAVYFGLAWALRCHEISEVYGIAFHSEHEPETAGLLP